MGPYEIVAPIGAGGMGEVYRATDTRLDRHVAVKVLPAEVSANAQFKLRFEREAKAISSLGHPHICTLFDVGHENGRDYLVLELLEGESLADRLQRGPLPMEQVIRYGAQIAGALDKAHRHGIIHRDLKPGNVMLTKSGAKLLDFGLAKASASPISADAPTAALATEHKPLTQEGTIVGTFQYMSPEQLEGRPADARSDLFSFGAVLYEMATGRRAFDGKTRASVIASILDREPAPVSSLQPMTPPALERLVHTCLRKDPDDRWQSAHDVASELQWIAEGGSSIGVASPIAHRRKRRELGWIAATSLLAILAALFAFLAFRKAETPPRVVRTQINAPEQLALQLFQDGAGGVSISPDAKWITFMARNERGDVKLCLRALDSLEVKTLDSADRGTYPFWSPDSRFIAFFAEGKLKRVSVGGGPATAIADALEPRGGAWGKDGTIVFAPHWRGSLMRVSAEGGKPAPLTTLDASRSETTHRYPWFLPDGEHYLYLGGTHFADEKSDLNAIYVGSLRSPERTLLLRARSNAIYAAGHLIFMRERALVAQPFDAKSRKLSGEPRQLAERVHYENGFFRGAFAAAQDGTLVYAPAGASSAMPLVWVDRTGKKSEIPGEPAEYVSMRVSPDGKRVVAAMNDPMDLWILDLDRGVRRRLTSDPLNELTPIWSPDGTSIVYSTDRGGADELMMRAADGSGSETQLLPAKKDEYQFPFDWSSDGRFLVYGVGAFAPVVSWDLWILPMTGERKPYPLIATQFSEGYAAFSPDGRWLSYASNETGRNEIYVTSSDGKRGKQQVSVNGANEGAAWSADGRELFYLAIDGTAMSVKVTATADSISLGTPQPMFRLSRYARADVAPDGRFLVVGPDDPNIPPLTLLTGWTPARE